MLTALIKYLREEEEEGRKSLSQKGEAVAREGKGRGTGGGGEHLYEGIPAGDPLHVDLEGGLFTSGLAGPGTGKDSAIAAARAPRPPPPRLSPGPTSSTFRRPQTV